MHSTVHRKLFFTPAATLSLGGYTHKAIAHAMNITTAQAKTHLGKARYVLGHTLDNQRQSPQPHPIRHRHSIEFRRQVLF